MFQDRKPEIHYPSGSELPAGQKQYLTGSELSHSGQRKTEEGQPLKGFHPNLSWSHYRALMRVDKKSARDFYETEAVACGWNRRQLERQIHSLFYERLLMSEDKQGMLQQAGAEEKECLKPVDVLKDPYVLEFLDLPDAARLHESDLEQAIIDNLQQFLLELGKGFSFVARQKRMRFGDEDFYVDLVFYNFILKCFLLIDLKIGPLTHQDIGQMDGYVRMYEEHGKIKGDNPTIGLILCSEKNETIARYSVLNENKRLFASKYMLYLPTEEELARELARERRLIEERRAAEDGGD
jgi:predicted nuclease of restriction endonuclease-like (RecB) superfamily